MLATDRLPHFHHRKKHYINKNKNYYVRHFGDQPANFLLNDFQREFDITANHRYFYLANFKMKLGFDLFLTTEYLSVRTQETD